MNGRDASHVVFNKEGIFFPFLLFTFNFCAGYLKSVQSVICDVSCYVTQSICNAIDTS